MNKQFSRRYLLPLGKRGLIVLVVAALSFASVFNTLQPQTANAVQLTQRKVTISSSKSNQAGVQYDFEFDWAAASAVNGVIFQFCTTPLGTCTLPNAMDVSNDLVTLDGHTGFPNNGTTPFAEVASNTGDCSDTGTTATVTMYCINRNEALSAAGTDATVDLGSILNPTLSSGNFLTVFVRISLYSDQNFTTANKVHDGTVATAIVRQLTTTGRVQERLEFCVAAITETAWDTAFPTDCAAFPTTTTVDLGVIDNLSVATSPVDNTATNPANDSFGIAMVDTNASSGVHITYFPEAATTVSGGDTDQLRAFRVLPTDCAALATTLTDQCFVSAANTGEAITAGSEMFGLNIACIVDSTGTTDGNLSKPAQGATIFTAYNNDLDDNPNTVLEEAANCENEAVEEVGFSNSAALQDLAASNTVVDDEMLAIRFAATAQSTTPTGQYTVVTTYVAIPTY